MIQVQILKNGEGETVGLKTRGHAGFAPRGKDLVCCAVSTLVINLVNSIEKLTKDSFVCDLKDETSISLRMRELSPGSKLLISSCILGIREIQKEYGSKFVKIIKKEVQQC